MPWIKTLVAFCVVITLVAARVGVATKVDANSGTLELVGEVLSVKM